jgi:hypothetical protein
MGRETILVGGVIEEAGRLERHKPPMLWARRLQHENRDEQQANPLKPFAISPPARLRG